MLLPAASEGQRYTRLAASQAGCCKHAPVLMAAGAQVGHNMDDITGGLHAIRTM